MTIFLSIGIGFLAALLLVAGIYALTRKHAGGPSTSRETSVLSCIEGLKAIGQLSVFRAFTKEIVTESDHSWGEIGKKYFTWIMSGKKMAMIFEFVIDFRYDLRSPDFQILESEGGYLLRMPVCQHEVQIKDIQFYDEQKGKLVPWLLGDVTAAFGGGFSEKDRNRLKDEARLAAQAQAQSLIANLGSEVEISAKQTLQALARGFGVENVRFEFLYPDRGAAQDDAMPNVSVKIAPK